jgi:hypothetical protein
VIKKWYLGQHYFSSTRSTFMFKKNFKRKKPQWFNQLKDVFVLKSKSLKMSGLSFLLQLVQLLCLRRTLRLRLVEGKERGRKENHSGSTS